MYDAPIRDAAQFLDDIQEMSESEIKDYVANLKNPEDAKCGQHYLGKTDENWTKKQDVLNKAMKVAFDKMNPMSIRDKTEYIIGSYSSWFSLGNQMTQQRVGREASVQVSLVTDQLSSWHSLTALGHTHAQFTTTHFENAFSPTDIANSNDSGLPDFLATPSGHFLRYNPDTKSIHDLTKKYGCIKIQ
jgi:hypothetical protein